MSNICQWAAPRTGKGFFRHKERNKYTCPHPVASRVSGCPWHAWMLIFWKESLYENPLTCQPGPAKPLRPILGVNNSYSPPRHCFVTFKQHLLLPSLRQITATPPPPPQIALIGHQSRRLQIIKFIKFLFVFNL